jgi:hypothetical protein
MATTGTGQLSLRKSDLLNQRNLGFGLKSVRMAHKATAGEAEIDLLALNTPPEMSANGYSQPTATELNAANIKTNSTNVQVVSSSKGILQQHLSYTVTSNTRILFAGFTADEGEIFTVKVSNQATTGIHAVDGDETIATGTLTAGTDEFIVGTPYEVNKNPSYQVGAVKVYLDGALQFRNVGNAAAAPSADGNYEEIDNGTGNGVTIKFNVIDGVDDRVVAVLSNGIISTAPTNSTTAAVQALQASLDTLIQDSALAFGNPETKYQPAPTQPDLSAFGARVLRVETSRRVVTADSAAVRTNIASYDFLRFDTTTGPGTFILNATPIDGETVEVWDPTDNWGTNSLTLDGNGNTVDGAATWPIGTDGAKVKLTYNSPTNNWLVGRLL